eukprot:EG_transcript_22887
MTFKTTVRKPRGGRTQLDGTLGVYRPDGTGRDMFIAPSGEGKHQLCKIGRVDNSWAERKNYDIFTFAAKEPEPAPYLQGHYAAAVTARRSLVTPELPPEPTPKAWPLKKEERYTRRECHHMNGLPKLPVPASCLPNPYVTTNRYMQRVPPADQMLDIAHVSGYQGHRPSTAPVPASTFQ